jgi:hypothetical protein
MVRVLDCSSVEVAKASVAVVVQMSVSDLTARLESFDSDSYLRDHPDEVFDYETVLAFHVVGRGRTAVSHPDEIVWFHATRVPRDTNFRSRGLLPLKACISDLHEHVTSIARELGIERNVGETSGSYAAKLNRLNIQGPSASLLMDAAVNPGSTHRNFLESPEIVEDIAREIAGFEPANDILNRYRESTEACVVSFRSREARPDVVSRTLAYLHSSMRGGSDPVFWNTCFDGAGQAVPPADIVDVQWIER